MIESNQVQQTQLSQPCWTVKDLVLGERIKKVTTQDLFSFHKDNQTFVAKLFKSQFRHNYQLQLTTLRQLQHPNIISIIYHHSTDSGFSGYSNGDMLVFRWAQHGSINQYIPLNGKVPESIARVIFLQMISALKYAATKQPNGIIHPNLLPSNVLLDAERQVKICGWSGEGEKREKKELIKKMLFSCCEILLLTLTGYMPFFKKDPKCDPLYRYIKPQSIHKFWQLFQKRVASKHKQFQFSTQLKQLISNVFLTKWTTFEEIQQSQWMKTSPLTHQEYTKFLSQHERQAKTRREQYEKKQRQRSQQKKRILLQYQQETLHGSSCRSSGDYQHFIQDYYNNCCTKHDVPASQCSELIPLYDDRPNFVIAYLKQYLRHLQGKDIEQIFGEEFAMESYEMSTEGNQVSLRFVFIEVNQELVDINDQVEVNVKSVIRFFKDNKNHLFAEVELIESDLSQFYDTQVRRFIEDKIKEYSP